MSSFVYLVFRFLVFSHFCYHASSCVLCSLSHARVCFPFCLCEFCISHLILPVLWFQCLVKFLLMLCVHFLLCHSLVFNLSIQLFPFLLPLTPVFRSFVSVKFMCLCLYLSGYASCFILVANLSCVLCLLFLPLSCYS